MTRCFEHPETPNLVTLATGATRGAMDPTQCGPTVAVSQWGGIRAMISPAVSIAGASAAPHHSGSPSSSQIAWLALDDGDSHASGRVPSDCVHEAAARFSEERTGFPNRPALRPSRRC